MFALFIANISPRPGCVLENITFQHNPKRGATPLITIKRISIEGSFASLFTKHVKHIRAENMHILIPPRNTAEHFQVPLRSNVMIEDLIADGAILKLPPARRTSNH